MTAWGVAKDLDFRNRPRPPGFNLLTQEAIMGSKAPPIPPEQRSRPSDKPHVEGGGHPRHADVNLKEQGRSGNIRQNTRNQGYQQDR